MCACESEVGCKYERERVIYALSVRVCERDTVGGCIVVQAGHICGHQPFQGQHP